MRKIKTWKLFENNSIDYIGIVDGKWERIIRSWLEERDPLFKEFNISIDRVN